MMEFPTLSVKCLGFQIDNWLCAVGIKSFVKLDNNKLSVPTKRGKEDFERLRKEDLTIFYVKYFALAYSNFSLEVSLGYWRSEMGVTTSSFSFFFNAFNSWK